jgi:hypothetical protein
MGRQKMKSLILALAAAATLSAASVPDHLGLQLYSLRVMALQQGWRAVLDQTRAFGLAYVEGGSPPKGLTAEQYKAELAARGLTMVSAGFPYEGLAKDISAAVSEARSLGVSYVMVRLDPAQGRHPFTDDDARKAAADFNLGRRVQGSGDHVRLPSPRLRVPARPERGNALRRPCPLDKPRQRLLRDGRLLGHPRGPGSGQAACEVPDRWA